ncbi:hypothetical protein [Kitasatospora sp. NPDC096140]|uniref:hypothetical protein n=1 Tax=Kitasatospora sp. NPDC096140 TaxID=3155425 RepID=UPI003327AC2F
MTTSRRSSHRAEDPRTAARTSPTHSTGRPSDTDREPVGAARRPRRVTPAVLAVTAASVLTLSTTALTTPAVADPGLKKTDRHVVVLVNLANARLANPDADRADARSHFFGQTGSLTSYYAANSGGLLGVVPAKDDGVFGPFDLAMDGSTCDTGKMAELARKALPSDLAYDHLSIVMPSNKACDWWGLGYQPGAVTWFQEGAVKDVAAIAHEMGHNLGFAHQERQVCTPGSFTSCTADGYSRRTPMGAGGEKKGLSAPELIAQKWLPEQQITTPTATATVHLTPLHAAANTAGVRAVDLPLGSGGDRIVVEYRTPDAGTPDLDVAQGVDVYRVPEGKYDHAVMIGNGKHDDKATTGSFTGTAALTDTATGLSLSVTDATATGADVQIRLGAGTTTPNPGPTTSATPTGPGSAPSATTAKPGTGTTPPPTRTAVPTPTPQAPSPSADAGDGAADIGTTGLPTPPAGTTAAGPDSLARTGAKVTVPALAGSALILAGGTTALLLRRRARQRRH